MGKLLQAKDAHDSIHRMGHWKVAGNKNYSYGTVHYDSSRGASLKVLGATLVDGPCKIIGVYEGGRCVTVFDAVGLGLRGNLMSPGTCISEYCFTEYWEGGTVLKSKKLTRFREVRFGINGLEGWYDRRAFEWVSLKGDEATVRYNRPENVCIFKDDNVLIEVGYAFSTSGVAIAQQSASITQTPRIIVKSVGGRKRSFYFGDKSMQNYMRFAHTFVGLLIGSDAFLYDCECTEEFCKFGKSTKKFSPERMFSLKRATSLPQMIRSDPLSVLVPLNDVPLILAAMSRFATVYFRERTVFERLLGYTYSWSDISEHTLPQMMFLFERISKLLYFEETRAEKHRRFSASGDYSVWQKIMTLRSIYRDRKRMDLVKRIFTPDPSLTDIMNIVFPLTDKVFRFLQGKRYAKRVKKLKKYLGARRNSGAHSGESARFSPELDVACSKFLLMEMQVMLLQWCGIGIDVLEGYFRRPFSGYSYLEKSIPKLLVKFVK